ncbi:hypothetical protein AB6Q56_23045 (plasmid) [Dechloromonas sp. ARDL1]|uniref:hypothetical protein n=1 Tax=Dechloromonas sp. ARDL1 TaxID=3322121 RepID=UPI003DA77E24
MTQLIQPMQPEEQSLPLPLSDAANLVVILAQSLLDWHRDTFDTALSDLLQLTRRKPESIGQVRHVLARELNIPHCEQWRVSAGEYERRRNQVFQALQQLLDAIANTAYEPVEQRKVGIQ